MKTELRLAWFLGLLLSACAGGSGSESGTFKVVRINLQPQESGVALNRAIRIQFNQDIKADSLSGSSVSITPLGPLTPESPSPVPFSGQQFLEDARTLIIQPACPTRADFGDAGLSPSASFELTVQSSLQSVTGLSAEEFSLQFSTRSMEENPLEDALPGVPLASAEASRFPQVLGWNALSLSNDPMEIVLSKPIDAVRLPKHPVKARFEAAPGAYYPVPVETVVLENCTLENRAVLGVTLLGILPPAPLELFLDSELRDLGGDRLGEDLLLARLPVAPKPVAGDNNTPDAYLEDFADRFMEDDQAALDRPAARWGQDGSLQPGIIFPGPFSDKDIIIGKDTANGVVKVIDTNFSTLIATDGSVVPVIDGQIFCRNFTLRRDLDGGNKNARLIGIGPNPLVINATGRVAIQSNCQLLVEGQDSPGVVTVGSANSAEPGAAGRASGGDGGIGSQEESKSTAKGGDGNGPFNLPGTGGKGGHSAFGAPRLQNGVCWYMQAVAAGGGGGHFANNENWADGDQDYTDSIEYISPVDGRSTGFRYGRFSDETDDDGCTSDSNTDVGVDNGPCQGTSRTTNTRGEKGRRGPRGQGNFAANMYIPGGDGQNPPNVDRPLPVYDAVTRLRAAAGGDRGQAIFTDENPENDFFGTQVFHEPGVGKVIIKGELERPQGGAGGGAGGDAVGSRVWPPGPNHNFIVEDYKGAGGGGGGGVVWIRAVKAILVFGEISADGGDGGNGENVICIGQAGGGSGGGAGGMIILESLAAVFLGTTAQNRIKVHANGGDRGYGSARKDAAEKCRQTDRCIDGLGNWVQCCTGTFNGGGIGGGVPAHSKRNSAWALGGAGGKGVIQVHVPHGEDGNVLPGNLGYKDTRPDGPIRVIDAPVDPTQRYDDPTWVDPDPIVLAPTFGYQSAARSRFAYLGWRNELLPEGDVFFDFAGLDAEGFFDFNQPPRTLVSGSGGTLGEDGLVVTLPSADFLQRIGENPRVLIHDVLLVGEERRIIQNAEFGEEGLVLHLEEPLSAGLDSWEIARTYVNASGFNENTSLQLRFQGARETFPGSGVVDEDSMTDLTADLPSLNGYPFIRFQADLDTNVARVPAQVPDPGTVIFRVHSLKLPFDF